MSGDDSSGHNGVQRPDAAHRLLHKLSQFIAEELDDDERQAFATLLAPGVARAHETDEEVTGFHSSGWLSATLPDQLRQAIRDRNLRIEGL